MEKKAADAATDTCVDLFQCRLCERLIFKSHEDAVNHFDECHLNVVKYTPQQREIIERDIKEELMALALPLGNIEVETPAALVQLLVTTIFRLRDILQEKEHPPEIPAEQIVLDAPPTAMDDFLS